MFQNCFSYSFFILIFTFDAKLWSGDPCAAVTAGVFMIPT